MTGREGNNTKGHLLCEGPSRNVIGSTAITVVSAFFQVQLCLCVCEDCFSLPNIKGDIAVVTDTLKEAWCADFNACHPVSSDIDILSQSFASYPNEKHVPLFKDTRVLPPSASARPTT